MTALTQIAPAAAAALVSAIWQSAVLVLCVAVCLRALPAVTAAARSLIWGVVFVLAVALHFRRFGVGDAAARVSSAGVHLDPRWAGPVVAGWALLSVLHFVRLVQSGIRLNRLVRGAKPVILTAELETLVRGLKVSVWSSVDLDVPSVVGFFQRRIVLPQGLVGQIDAADLRQIVLHELEHLRRRDDWTNLLQKLALMLFPLNPVLLWVERRLCVERELACDDGVLRETGGAGKAYATCLANLAETSLLRRGVSLALGAWQRQSELGRRVQRILHNPVRTMKPSHRVALAAGVLSAGVGTGLLAVEGPELVSFRGMPAATPSAVATAVPLRPLAARATVRTGAGAQLKVTRAVLAVSRVHVQRRRASAWVRRYPARADVVLIGWVPDEFRARRPSFQLTYAAVPTRTGWLFFQL